MSKYTYFVEEEFDCCCDYPDCTCEDLEMDVSLMTKLDELRRRFREPLIPTSGKRCVKHNKDIGGASKSLHLKAKAVDFYLEDAVELNRLYNIAEELNFGGIGKGKHLLHLDVRNKYSRWSYD